jgi:DNA-binding transcriptional LysR family regulator
MENIAGEMTVFTRVIERGSFAAAADDLGLSPSAVSKLMTRLESRLGVRLIMRTTRRIALTAEGELFSTAPEKSSTRSRRRKRRLRRDGGDRRGICGFMSFRLSRLITSRPRFRISWPATLASASNSW